MVRKPSAAAAISQERRQETSQNASGANSGGDIDQKLSRLQDMLRMAKQNWLQQIIFIKVKSINHSRHQARNWQGFHACVVALSWASPVQFAPTQWTSSYWTLLAIFVAWCRTQSWEKQTAQADCWSIVYQPSTASTRVLFLFGAQFSPIEFWGHHFVHS